MNSVLKSTLLAVVAVGSLLQHPHQQRPQTALASVAPAVRAVEFESRKVYQSDQHPSYTSWVSFFPGEKGQWYLGCVEQKKINPPNPGSTPEQYYWRQGGAEPPGYDHKRNHIEMILLESRDQFQTWKTISRWNVGRLGTAAWGSFAQARTADGRFLRFIWNAYSDELDKAGKLIGNRIFYVSSDNGKSWQLQPPFHDDRFFSFAHRLRTLRDGTLVLAMPFSPAYGPGHDRPTRLAWDPQDDTNMQMMLYFSRDQGRHWSGPMPIYGGQAVSETDFVELPSGDLLFINWMGTPGRQIVYRSKEGWLPGPYERCVSNKMGTVPETVALTKEGLLIGCLRPGHYFWSDDLGKSWQPLDGIPNRGPEVYQPWMQYLRDGRIACAGHYGGDDPMGGTDQYVSLHLFRIEATRKTHETKLTLQRDFDQSRQKWQNAYTFTLTSDGAPLPGKDVQVWYVERDKPGYDAYGKLSVEDRLHAGGHVVGVRTGADGRAKIAFPQFDNLTWQHHTIQIFARFNADRTDPLYKPAQTLVFEFYTWTR